MAVVGNLIGQVRDLRFQRRTTILFRARHRRIVKRLMLAQAFAHFERQIQPGKIRIRRLEQLDHPRALLVVVETAMLAHAFRQHFLARVSERRMPEIVRERDRLGQVFI